MPEEIRWCTIQAGYFLSTLATLTLAALLNPGFVSGLPDLFPTPQSRSPVCALECPFLQWLGTQGHSCQRSAHYKARDERQGPPLARKAIAKQLMGGVGGKGTSPIALAPHLWPGPVTQWKPFQAFLHARERKGVRQVIPMRL